MKGFITSYAVYFYESAQIVSNTTPYQVAAFDCSAFFLIIAGFWIFQSWNENYGDSTIDVSTSLANGFKLLKNDLKVLLLGFYFLFIYFYFFYLFFF